MDCNKIDMLFMKYMDNTLDEKEAHQINEHIKGCDNCRKEFEAYDELMNGFLKMTELVEAPSGFEESVMTRIKALPETQTKPAEKKDNFVYIIWASVSAILGLGVLLTLYKDNIINYLSQNPNLSFILGIFEPVSTAVSNTMLSIVSKAQSFITFAINVLSQYRYYLLAGVVLFGAVYVLRSKHSAVKQKND